MKRDEGGTTGMPFLGLVFAPADFRIGKAVRFSFSPYYFWIDLKFYFLPM